MAPPRGLVAFDLDGTLLRGPTVCEHIAEALGRADEMRRFEASTREDEIAAARREMARWYEGLSAAQLCEPLERAAWAPGAEAAVRSLQRHGVEVAIASITWDVAVEWAARRLGIRRYLGTALGAGGHVHHVWPRDKGAWVRRVATDLGVPAARVAAVGDSPSDADLLGAASLRFFVGARPPSDPPGIAHRPDGDLLAIAQEILAQWVG